MSPLTHANQTCGLLESWLGLTSGLKSIFAGLGLEFGKICNQVHFQLSPSTFAVFCFGRSTFFQTVSYTQPKISVTYLISNTWISLFHTAVVVRPTTKFRRCAKFHVNRCNESPLRGENVDFWPVSQFHTGSLPLRSILPVKNIQTPHFRTYSRRALSDLSKRCMVVELVVPILKDVNYFSSQFIVFPLGGGQKVDFWPLSKFKYPLDAALRRPTGKSVHAKLIPALLRILPIPSAPVERHIQSQRYRFASQQNPTVRQTPVSTIFCSVTSYSSWLLYWLVCSAICSSVNKGRHTAIYIVLIFLPARRTA